jgi:hypothetical protein
VPPITAELLFWLGGPLLLSIAALVAGLVVLRRRKHRQAGRVLFLAGIAGLILSTAWIALVFRVEAIEHDSLGRLTPSASAARLSPTPA